MNYTFKSCCSHGVFVLSLYAKLSSYDLKSILISILEVKQIIFS